MALCGYYVLTNQRHCCGYLRLFELLKLYPYYNKRYWDNRNIYVYFCVCNARMPDFAWLDTHGLWPSTFEK